MIASELRRVFVSFLYFCFPVTDRRFERAFLETELNEKCVFLPRLCNCHLWSHAMVCVISSVCECVKYCVRVCTRSFVC